MASITLESLRKEFGDTTAVDGIDLEIVDGEFLVLVGPSGCGKSTLLRTIAGLEKPTGGDLYIGDDRVNDTEASERGVAMVFQNYALYPHMSAKRNMTFGVGSHRSLTDEELDEEVEEIASMLGIAELLGRRPDELSGGEKQRVAMGRALLREPDVFLLDEPLSNLDAKLRDEMRVELTELHNTIQTTTVYVTHDQTEAMTLGDRVAVMNEGRIEQVDRPEDVYDRPTSRFVAEFIGSPRINLIEVDIDADSEFLHLSREGFTIDFPAPSSTTQIAGRQLSVGIRPEDLYFADEVGADSLSAPFNIEITHQETLGSSEVIHGRLGDEVIRVQTSARRNVSPGDHIRVVVDPTRLHLFATDTGELVSHSETAGDQSQVVDA